MYTCVLRESSSFSARRPCERAELRFGSNGSVAFQASGEGTPAATMAFLRGLSAHPWVRVETTGTDDFLYEAEARPSIFIMRCGDMCNTDTYPLPLIGAYLRRCCCTALLHSEAQFAMSAVLSIPLRDASADARHVPGGWSRPAAPVGGGACVRLPRWLAVRILGEYSSEARRLECAPLTAAVPPTEPSLLSCGSHSQLLVPIQ